MKKSFDEIWKIVERLRAPDGCPWDRAQTNETIKFDLVEEAYEVLDAIDKKDWDSLREELGDVIFLAMLHTKIAEDEEKFSHNEVIDTIVKKMIYRHPHVFGKKKFENQDELLENWEKSKGYGIFEHVNFSLPALMLAQKIGNRASRVGFDWTKGEDVLEKIKEELEELRNAQNREEIEEEIGDLLFSIVNFARHKDINAEEALRNTLKKFVERFSYIERKAQEMGKNLEQMSLGEMDALWEEAKKK